MDMKISGHKFCPTDQSNLNMADHKNKESGRTITDQQGAPTAEETQNIDATDDFDPFSGVVECVYENVDIALCAPPENECVFVVEAMALTLLPSLLSSSADLTDLTPTAGYDDCLSHSFQRQVQTILFTMSNSYCENRACYVWQSVNISVIVTLTGDCVSDSVSYCTQTFQWQF